MQRLTSSSSSGLRKNQQLQQHQHNNIDITSFTAVSIPRREQGPSSQPSPP